MTRPEGRRAANRRPTEPRSRERPPPRQVSRQQYRRRRLAAGLIAVLAIVGLGLTARVVLYDLGLADVEDVQVIAVGADGVPLAGLTAVPADDVLAAAAVAPGGPLAAVDTGAIAGRVAELPPVESVEVARSWPHTVLIEVVERVPVAVVQTAAGPSLVDRSGVVYRAATVPDLPRLTVASPGPADPATMAAIAVLAAVPEPVRGQIRSIDVAVAGPGVPGQVTLGLTQDRQVRWGTPERGADKAAVLGPLLGEPGQIYDVTSPDLPTIRR